MVLMGCDSLSMDPLKDFPQMQEQAVDQLAASFDRFSVSDEKVARKILKALAVLFESSYALVAWFLKKKKLSTLGEYASLDVHVEAVRALSRGPYWSAEDAPLLPEFAKLLAQLTLGCIDGHAVDASDAPTKPPAGRVIDLTEAEQVVSACITSVLHLLLIDPSPPSVLHILAQYLGCDGKVERQDSLPPLEDDDENSYVANSEKAVNNVMRIMQVFPSSDRVQMNCQHLLTSLLGE